MKKLFVSYCTEYEKDWGRKSDGIVISDDLNTLVSYIEPYNKREKGSYDLFWNYTPPDEIWCTEEHYDQMVFDDGLMFASSFYVTCFKFYKEL